METVWGRNHWMITAWGAGELCYEHPPPVYSVCCKNTTFPALLTGRPFPIHCKKSSGSLGPISPLQLGLRRAHRSHSLSLHSQTQAPLPEAEGTGPGSVGACLISPPSQEGWDTAATTGRAGTGNSGWVQVGPSSEGLVFNCQMQQVKKGSEAGGGARGHPGR